MGIWLIDFCGKQSEFWFDSVSYLCEATESEMIRLSRKLELAFQNTLQLALTRCELGTCKAENQEVSTTHNS